MTVKEFYEKIGGDYEMAIATFRTDEKIYKFLSRYADDPSYQRLCNAADAGDIQEAFEGAHALKGVASMFYLTPVFQAVVELVEQLRPLTEPADEAMLQNVREKQQFVLEELAKVTIS